VTVSDNQFAPSSITVAPGTIVTWTWSEGSSVHNVTFSDGASGDKGAGATYQKTFPTAGTFSYQCTIHAGMSGTVRVQ
jgi:plastocyanin